ncbi:MAG TPA: TIM barrel protein [Polyangia bacterium]|nr:TIM barrel protein [Polyangia bacterium]
MATAQQFRAALTTTFAHASAAPLGPTAILDVVERAQASGLIFDSGLPRDVIDELTRELERRGGNHPVVALESPSPRVARGDGREPELCAPDRDEAQTALAAAEATVHRAGELRAPFVIVRLGAVRPVASDWPGARDRFLRGELDHERARRLMQTRDAAAERSVDGAMRALDRLARRAERAGVTLLVRNGRRYHDVPSARELDDLRVELRGAPVAPLLDVPAAHLLDVMGFAPLALTLAAFAPAPLCYFGDACGAVGALAPGRGVVDLAAVRAALGDGARLAFSPWAGLAVDEIIAAVPQI